MGRTTRPRDAAGKGHSVPDISRDEVAHLARLSHLDVTEAELDEFAAQLDTILGYVKTVSEVDTEDVPGIVNVTGVVNVVREDVVVPGLTPAQALAGAPATEDTRFVAPQILGEEQ